MSKQDRYKEEFALHKQIFFVSGGLTAGVSGWLANNYQDTTITLLAITGLTILGLTIVTALEYKKLRQLLKKIESQ